MIKVVNLVSLIAAPVLVRYSDLGWGGWLVVVLLAAGFVWGVTQSKKPNKPFVDIPAEAGD
jgi:K(+)-stimulated pyrophosphate-energized sodium pump